MNNIDVNANHLINILFVEDHRPLLDTLAEYFSDSSQYQSDFASDGLTALHLLATNSYDVVVLDIMLPGINGVDIIRRVRNDLQANMPILLLTALDDIEMKTEGFEAGADDYLCKPFNLKELELRIKALLKRQLDRNTIITIEGLSFDPGTLILSKQNAELCLTGYPGLIFELLIQSHPNYVSFSKIGKLIWGDTEVDENTIRTHVYTLRKQLKNTFGKSMIKSIHKKGYQFKPDFE